MEVADFTERVLADQESKDILKDRAEYRYDRDKKYTLISSKMKFKRPKPKNHFIPADDLVASYDFLGTSFGGDPIPDTKLDRNIRRIRNRTMELAKNIEVPIRVETPHNCIPPPEQRSKHIGVLVKRTRELKMSANINKGIGKTIGPTAVVMDPSELQMQRIVKE